jgi:hypothetical protein
VPTIDRNAFMIRAAIITSTLAIALSLVGCRGSPPATPVSSPDAELPVDVRSAAPAYEIHEIAVVGDGRSVPIALAETDAGIALFVTEPTGIGRYAIDLDESTATQTRTVPLEHYTSLAAYERAQDRLWWTAAVEQHRRHQPSNDGDFPRGDLVVTHASEIVHTDGMRETIRVCPPSALGSLGGGGGGPLCDHEIRVLLPAFGGVVLGGHLSERVGQASARPWLGFADASGALTIERRLPEGMGEAWIDALAQSDAGVLAVSWSGRGEPARSSFSLFGGPTLEPIATAARTTPSWVSVPWSAAVAAPDGSFWIALTTARHELTIVAIARDGSIASERTIEGAKLPITSMQSLGVRRGQPWLMIANPYADPHPTLWVGRIDPATGEVPERHEIPLPADFYPSRMLALDRGFVLAGRVGIERPLVVWIPWQGSELADGSSEPIPDETDLRFTNTTLHQHSQRHHRAELVRHPRDNSRAAPERPPRPRAARRRSRCSGTTI